MTEYLELTWQCPIGSPGVDREPMNPLRRAVDRLFANGIPIKSLCNCFFNGGSAQSYWLGVFVHSAGDRILFFPGFSSPQTYVSGQRDKAQSWDRAFDSDHASLERDRKSWHLTSPESADHIGKLPVMDLGDSRTFWFGLSIAGEGSLLPVMNSTVVRFYSPEVDSDRRAQIFVTAVKDVEFPLVTLNTEYERLEGPSFLHFSIIVGPIGFSRYEGAFRTPPLNGPLISRPEHPPADSVPIRSYRARLSETVELQIDASEISGTLRMPFVYSTPMEKEH